MRIDECVPISVFVTTLSKRSRICCAVGPLVSKIGLRTVDIGAPILSMHSCVQRPFTGAHSADRFSLSRIREMAGVKDVKYLIDLFEKFFERFGVLDTLAETVD